MVDTSKYKKMFIDETMEHITSINDTLPLLEDEDQAQEAMNTLFRNFHSIKGMAASMSYRSIQEISHKLEDLLDAMRSGKIACSPAILDLLYDGSGLIEKGVQLVEEDSREELDTDTIWERLKPLLAGGSPAVEKVTPAPLPPKKEPPPDLTQEELAELSTGEKPQYKIEVAISGESPSPAARAYLLINLLKAKSEIQKSIPTIEQITKGEMESNFTLFITSDLPQPDIESLIKSSIEIEKFSVTKIDVVARERDEDPGDQYATRKPPGPDKRKLFSYRKPGAVKVDTPVLDGFIDIVGEMFIQQNQLLDIVRSLESPAAVESVNRQEKLVRSFYKEVMKIRLVPVSLLTDILPRVTREVLRGTEKKVETVIEGKEIKLDRSIVEKLGDPVIHIVRNSLDHGIEPPDERVTRGKAETAKLTFKAAREKESIVIEISDDGRGLNTERIKEKIISRGLADSEFVEKMDSNEIHNFIWQPGFSTAEKVTAVSGRGVGMDIVRNVVEGLGGTVSVASELGKGSTFRIQVPMSISIIRTFRIKLEEDIFAVPLGKIIRTMDIPRDELKEDESGYYFYYREERIPVKDLKTILEYKRDGIENKKGISILIVEIKGNVVGLIVDAFIAGYETVVKPLNAPLERLEMFAGASMSEKGELILILDIDRLLLRRIKK